MRLHALAALVLLGACATPYARVKDAKTIEQARALLGSYEPKVTPYPPNAEAWYFGKNECVLFVDGALRLSKSSSTQLEGGVAVRPDEQKQVLCAPSELKP
ncbi:MAG: hypothetical protein ACOZQL_34960 [Myxococcota bacterium]